MPTKVTNPYTFNIDKNITVSADISIIQLNITITQTANQTITVTAGDKQYTESFTIPYGTEYTVAIAPSAGYTAGKLSIPATGTFTANTTITATAATLNTYTVTITQSDHQTITVNDGNKDYTQTFTAPYGTKLTAKIVAEEGYNAGSLSATSITVTGNITISASAASLKGFTITITQSEHQTITVSDGTKSYTQTFTAPYGTKLTATIAADEGYTAGKLNKTTYTVTAATTFSASSATMNSYTVTITQSANQTITVNDGETDHTTSFTAPYGTKLTATIAVNTGYTAGKLNQTSVTVTGDITFSATAATINTYTITITQSDNQTITVSDGTKSYTQTFTAPYGTKLTATIAGATGYNPGTLNQTAVTVTSNTSFSASPASLKGFTITITQSANQTITVSDGNKSYTQSFTAPYGTKLTATIAPSVGYTAGKLNQTAVTVTDNTTFSATAATINTYTVTITQSDHQTITVLVDGVAHTSTFTVPYGTKYTASIVPETGWNAGALSSASGTVTGNITISATEASQNMFGITITQSANQTITVNDGTTDHTESFQAAYGTKLTATIAPAAGYTAGKLNQTTVTVTKAVEFNATPATINTYTVTITQSANQTITVSDGTKTYTQSFTAPYGTKLTATIAASEGYTAGKLNQTSVTVTSNTTFSATAAVLQTYTVTITQSANQTITVSDGTKSYTQTFTAPYGTKLTASITPATGYNAGTLNHTTLTLTEDTTFSATAATLNTFTITITQSANQTITVSDGTTDHTTTFTAPYGTKLTATIAPSAGYIAGKLNQTAYTVTANTTFSASAATVKMVTVRIKQGQHSHIEVNGETITEKQYPWGTSVKIEAIADSGYKVDALYVDQFDEDPGDSYFPSATTASTASLNPSMKSTKADIITGRDELGEYIMDGSVKLRKINTNDSNGSNK